MESHVLTLTEALTGRLESLTKRIERLSAPPSLTAPPAQSVRDLFFSPSGDPRKPVHVLCNQERFDSGQTRYPGNSGDGTWADMQDADDWYIHLINGGGDTLTVMPYTSYPAGASPVALLGSAITLTTGSTYGITSNGIWVPFLSLTAVASVNSAPLTAIVVKKLKVKV